MSRTTAPIVSTINNAAPILRGRICCSQYCGGSCTKADFDKANRNAAALAKVAGDGWVPHVWENLGWHYSARKGVAALHVHGKTVTLYINTTPQIVVDAPTVAACFLAAKDVARSIIADISFAMNAAMETIEPPTKRRRR